MKYNLFITGTPCVGKTTIAKKLASQLNAELIPLNEFAIKKNLTLGTDPQKGYQIIDINKLNTQLSQKLNTTKKITIVEGHLSHLCSNADNIIVLRLNPHILKKRLNKRNYNKNKIQENLEAEALNICGTEAFYKYNQKVNEIDCTHKKTENIVNQIISTIYNQKKYPFGDIDYLNWIIENQKK